MTDAGWAGAAENVVLELLREVSHSTQQRVDGCGLEAAQRRVANIRRERPEKIRIARSAAPRAEAVAELGQAPRADAAGNRLAAGLVAEEARHQRREVDDAAAAVDGQDRAGAHDRPRLGQSRMRKRCVEGLRRQEPARWPADLECLELAAGHPAGHSLDQGAQRRSRGHLRDAGRGHRATQLHQGRARVVSVTDRGVGGRPVAHDPGHRSQRLDVVDERRLVPQSALGRPRRPLIGLGALVLDRAQEDGLLADRERPGKLANLDPQLPAGAEHVAAEVARSLGRVDRGSQAADRRAVARVDHQVGVRGVDGERRKREALQHGVGIRFHERSIDLRARVGFEAVGDGVAHGGLGGTAGAPLLPGREAAAAPAAQPGLGHGPDQGLRREGRRGPTPRRPCAAALRRNQASPGGVRVVGAGSRQQDRGPAPLRLQDLHVRPAGPGRRGHAARPRWWPGRRR